VRRAAAIIALSFAACSGEAELSPCDIRRADCQQQIALAVQSVRSGSWDPWLDVPPMRVITKQQYRDELEQARLAREAAARANDHDYFTPAFRLFHLIDPDEPPQGVSDYISENFVAYYDSARRDVTIIDRGEATDRFEDSVTLAHELVHAAQERDIGFTQIESWIDSTDSDNAVGTLVEGEAVLYERLVGLMMNGGQADLARFASADDAWITAVREEVQQNPSPLRDVSANLRYPLGSMYMSAAWAKGGALGVRRAFASHPATSLELMGGPARANRASPCSGPRAPDGYQPAAWTALGAWGLFAFATRLTSDDGPAWDAALTWDDDAFWIFAGADQAFAALWQLHFRDALTARAFRALAKDQLPEGVSLRETEHDETLALFAASSGAAKLDAWAWQQCESDD
jgi:hypothetical protein